MLSTRMVGAIAKMKTKVTCGIRICLKSSSLDRVIICSRLRCYVHVGIAHRQHLHSCKDAPARSIHTLIEVSAVVLGVSAMLLRRRGSVFQSYEVRAANELLP